MSIGNEDNAASDQANAGNDNGTAGTGPLSLLHVVASDLPSGVNVNPPSTRTSVTRVEHDDEARSRQSITNDAVTTLAGTSTLAPGDSANVAVDPSPVHEEERAVSSHPTPEPSEREPLVVQQVGEVAEDAVPQTPQTYVTFLLISGKRRTLAFEPTTTIARVKELAWNSWSADWQDERPPAPSFLRVLYLGRMLQDDETLSKLKLPASSSNGPNSTIMHLSVRPYPLPGEADGVKKKKKRGRSDTSESNEGGQETGGAGCCRCLIC